jgi:predicted ATP-dependent endonuclease of OLD family
MKRNILTEFIFDTNKDNSGISFDGDYSIQEEGGVINILKELNDFNIFVGANNSGKSRVLRAIYRQNDLVTIKDQENISDFISRLDELIKKTKHAPNQFKKTTAFIQLFKSKSRAAFWHFEVDLITGIKESIAEIQKHLTQSPNFFFNNGSPAFMGEVTSLIDENNDNLTSIYKTQEFHRLYVPILRGLRTFVVNGVNEDIYETRTKNDYFSNDQETTTKQISTGLSLYKEIREKLLGGHNDRQFIKEYEDFLKENFFDNRPVTLVPREKDENGEDNDVVFITFDNNSVDDRPIYSYGDGLQNIITITYPIFSWINTVSQDNQLLLACIEEPEIYLHPSMQRKLVEVLMTKLSTNVQYFVTTHSNHFLDLFSEPEFQEKISVYSVNPRPDGVKNIKKEIDISDPIYNLLGAKPSSLLLANKTIWVEGVTDRLYIRHAISLYFEKTGKNKLVENLDYSYVEYSGSNLQHYIEKEKDIEIKAISHHGNVFMIADKDDSDDHSGAKHKRYNEVSKQLAKAGGKFKITDGIEIENYIKPDIIKKIWKKVPSSITQNDYLNESLPGFLSKHNNSLHIKDNSFGSNKKTIAIKVIDEQHTWADLSPEMQQLIEELITFVTPDM